MKYFNGEIKDLDHLKSIYKSLSKKYHPDMGGTQDEFVEMKLEYDHLKRIYESGREESNLDLIDDLVEARKSYDYKIGWEYFKFIELAVEPTLEDFHYLAEQLGYKQGWGWYKYKEYYENE